MAQPSRNPAIVKEDIALPRKQNKLAFLLHNVFTKEECKHYIKKTEKMGYTAALVNVGAGRQQLRTDIRNSSRCIWDSEDEAEIMWERIKPYIPEEWLNSWKAVGLNERLRFLRYDKGEYFAPHFDGQYRRENGERSYITVQVYLNEGFEGGCTTFLDPSPAADPEKDYPCIPRTGSVLVFEHCILHEGSVLKSGRKYAVRTDVMYCRMP